MDNTVSMNSITGGGIYIPNDAVDFTLYTEGNLYYINFIFTLYFFVIKVTYFDKYFNVMI